MHGHKQNDYIVRGLAAACNEQEAAEAAAAAVTVSAWCAMLSQYMQRRGVCTDIRTI